MKITEALKDRRLILDGGTGTLLQSAGLAAGELPETWNILHPERIAAVHRAYFAAGSDIVCTNTFGANSLKYNGKNGNFSLSEIVTSAVRIAGAERSAADGERFIALDIGPLGKLLKPYGDLEFEEAVSIFAETVKIGAAAGVDLIYFETFSDTYELKAAIIAAKENCDLPIFATCAFDETGHLMTGADVPAVVALLEGLGVDALGANCGLGPDKMAPVIRDMLKYSSLPVIAKPNAGLPRNENGKTVFDVTPPDFSADMKLLAEVGAGLLGGCCGTTPEHISATVGATYDIPFSPPTQKHDTLVSSYSHAVKLGDAPMLIGERINPTGKKAFKEALRSNDMAYILNQGIAQQNAGAHILDVNVGLPEINESEMMRSAVTALQSVIDLPLQIDTSDAVAMETALRIYNGKPLINSVNGKADSMSSVFPLAKKYGGVVVGLTLDENGIPDNAEDRLKIAKKIVDTAATYGIDRKNIIIDPLTLTVATDPNAANVTLESVKLIDERLGVPTCLGVSNVSFGLPDRDRINSAFFTLAMGAGLKAAIMNPLSEPMMNAYRNYLALSGADAGCAEYIASAQNAINSTPAATSVNINDLHSAIISGLREASASLTRELLKTSQPMDIINNELIPALNKVGDGFANKTVFLPQLLMSADAAGAAFEVIRSSMPIEDGAKKEKIIIATVKGDIHDIGKNIVHALLENYNYSIIDLGKDITPENIVDTAKRESVKLVALSALMTTTVPAMEETIKALRVACPDTKIMVGGAVLTQEYADMIGADHYAPDAMDAVRYAETIFAK